MNKTPAIAANIIKPLSAKKFFLPGIFIAIHNFGRDFKLNLYIHLSATVDVLRISNKHKSWVKSTFFCHAILKTK